MRWLNASSLIIFQLSFLACSKVETSDTSDSIGYDKSVTPQTLTDADKEKVRDICDALTSKDASGLVGNFYDFDYATRSCGDEAFGSSSVVETEVAQDSSDYYFYLKGSSTKFYFPDVETETKGAMAEICDELATNGTLVSPITDGSDHLFFTTSSILASDCKSAQGEQCIYLERGSDSTTTGFAKITEREWIRLRVDPAEDKIGFFTFRKYTFKSDCADNQSRGRLAELK